MNNGNGNGTSTGKALKWIQDIVAPKTRRWEEFYRNRWQHDKRVRSTHGVNCTGGCSWEIFVKDGIVTWELQALDYPLLESSLPPYEPRGCQRGISYSWYLYSPLRVRYPYVRGPLLDLWRQLRQQHSDPVDAWAALQNDPQARERYQRARGKGGFRRAEWRTALELMAAANVHTAKKWGPDRVIGFSPIPAMSFMSYGGGSRFLQLFGGVNLSFYDWYCDLPNASPEAWGEQTDVQESADWYNAKFLAVMGSNLNMTRTPDCHFAAEARHNGTKMVVFAPDFNQVAKYADEWVPINKGQDGAFWMAVNHVILKEFHHEKKTPYFLEYVKRYTDTPFLVEMQDEGGKLRPGKFLRANTVSRYADAEHGDWKFLVWDKTSNEPRMPGGAVGHRWPQSEEENGKWNLKQEEAGSGEPLEFELTFLEQHDKTAPTLFDDFGNGVEITRSVPLRKVETSEGTKWVATVYDLLMAQYGVDRGLDGDNPAKDYDDDVPFTPAWQEKWTGISRDDILRFARQWAGTAEGTNGKCTVIIGAGINHWYHNNLIYRAAMNALMLCGCVGVNGGGLAHYVGQEKLAPMAAWSTIAFGKDWQGGQRLQNAPSWHYVNSDQWRYERQFREYAAMPNNEEDELASGHTMDLQTKAVRLGWLPFYPQFNRNSIDLVKEAEAAGCKSDEEIVQWVVEQLKQDKLKFAVEDPDAEENWPRVWYIWRGNALMSSAKGHEYMLNHYLGTHHNELSKEVAEGTLKETVWRDAVKGKFDLVVDINFRMDTSALYSDVVLPAATFYEKADLNSTDLHSYIHPLSRAVPPVWETKSDWQAFRSIAEKTAALAKNHLPGKVREIHCAPLAHDSPDELAQPNVKDWKKGECEAVPGKTMPHIKVVTRDYENLHERFCALGPAVKEGEIGAHGVKYFAGDVYEQMIKDGPVVEVSGERYPSVRDDEDACNAVLLLASETNGELAYRGYEKMEKKVGLKLTDLAEGNRAQRITYKDLQAQPRRLLNSPVWSGLLTDGRAYSPFTYNVERLVPWRTLTGRQSMYLDHDGYLAFGEHLPTFKPGPSPMVYGDLVYTDQMLGDAKRAGELRPLNLLTPHGKWHIHSTYGDNERMTTLSRGLEPFWCNDKDAEEFGINDNDWVEVHNDHGVYVTRACVSARIPRGVCIIYHSPERTYGNPKSNLRGNRRGGGHNSLTRTRLKPVLMFGGYAQFTYHFNYWGPTGVNRDTHVYVRKVDQLLW